MDPLTPFEARGSHGISITAGVGPAACPRPMDDHATGRAPVQLPLATSLPASHRHALAALTDMPLVVERPCNPTCIRSMAGEQAMVSRQKAA